jgi:hypothetical protein
MNPQGLFLGQFLEVSFQGPSANQESGHFYFAQTGHSHFAVTRLTARALTGVRR